jgi:hypothetical protein
MSTKRSDQDALGDAVVTQIYRESATERAPAELDVKILRDARGTVGSPYLQAIGWLRPMAWAATVGLSLAIVLELSNLPYSEGGAIDVPIAAPIQPSEGDARDVSTAAPIEAPEVDALTAPVAASIESSEDVATEVPVAAPAPAAPPDARFEALQKAAVPAAARPSSPDNSEQREAAVDVDAFRVTDAPLLEEAADLARMRDGPRQQAEIAVSGATSLSVEPVAACQNSRTVDPETWLACIDELAAAGRSDDAERERERLQKTFPDFEMP